MSGLFGPGPDQRLPFGHVDIVQPVEAPEDYDKHQRRKVEASFQDLADEMEIRIGITEDLAIRPGIYQLRLVGRESRVNEYRRRLAELSFD